MTTTTLPAGEVVADRAHDPKMSGESGRIRKIDIRARRERARRARRPRRRPARPRPRRRVAVVDEHREPCAARLATIPRPSAPAPMTPQRITRRSASAMPRRAHARAPRRRREDERAVGVDREVEAGEHDDRRVRELDDRRARRAGARAEREPVVDGRLAHAPGRRGPHRPRRRRRAASAGVPSPSSAPAAASPSSRAPSVRTARQLDRHPGDE